MARRHSYGAESGASGAIRVILCAAFLFFCTNSATAADPIRPPNIVLILADDLGYGDLGCYGAKDIRTPNLDRMAREGTRFTNFCVAQPVCTASRAAIMSGCYPNRIGMAGALNHTSTIGIHPDEVLLPELCQQKGYATAHYGKWHLGTRPVFFPTRNGFDEWVGLPYSNDNGPLHPTVRGIPALPLYANDKVIATDPDQSQFTKLFTEKAVGFIKTNKAKPFFVYLPHIMPHVPIFASEPFKGKSGRGLYGDVVEELDWSVGEIFKAIKECNLDNDTLVLFLSDNGPFLSYGSHAGSAGRFREGKLTTFEGGVCVPFLARWPGKIAEGMVCDELMTGLDLLPTIAKVIGSDLPKVKIDGVDLSPLLLCVKGAKGRDSFGYFSGSELHAVRSGKWKLHFPHEYLTVNGIAGKDGKPANHEKIKPDAIEESGIRGIASRHGYKVEKLELSLFDLEADPGESKNVAASQQAVVERLKALGNDLRRDLGDPLTGIKGAGLRSPGHDKTTPKP
ncbi:MAG: arylsulfatase [Planctomycetaceae bacterium]|nr:arylsulfatase [Planctomycetaceae bacterium]